MNETPTSGPMSTSITQNEREVMSSRHSFLRSQFQALREGKEDLLEIRRQGVARALLRKCGERVEGSLGDNQATAQKHETVAYLGGVGNLVDRQKEGAVGSKVLSQRRRGVAALSQVETFERFVDQKNR